MNAPLNSQREKHKAKEKMATSGDLGLFATLAPHHHRTHHLPFKTSFHFSSSKVISPHFPFPFSIFFACEFVFIAFVSGIKLVVFPGLDRSYFCKRD